MIGHHNCRYVLQAIYLPDPAYLRWWCNYGEWTGMSVFLPPNSVRGMKSLTRELFAKVVEVPAIKINSKQCENFLSYFKKKALRHQGIKGVHDISDCDQNYNKVFILVLCANIYFLFLTDFFFVYFILAPFASTCRPVCR